MKFHCNSRYPSAKPLILLRDGEMAMPKSTGGTGNGIPASQLPPQPPAHSSLHALPTKGLLSRFPRPARQRPKRCHGAEIPQRGAEGPGVTGHSPGARTLALGQSPAAGTSRRYGKNKESLPAITGFSNMANHAIFTGAYLFSEGAGTDSRVSFFSPAVFKDRFELALFKGFASCPLFLTPCTSLCVPPLLQTKQTPEKTQQQQQKKHQNHTPTALQTQTYKGPLSSRKQSSFQAILLKP